MDFSIDAINSNPLMAIINPASIPVVAATMISKENPNILDGLFDGFKVSKSGEPIAFKGLDTKDPNSKYYIIGAILLLVIYMWILKRARK